MEKVESIADLFINLDENSLNTLIQGIWKKETTENPIELKPPFFSEILEIYLDPKSTIRTTFCENGLEVNLPELSVIVSRKGKSDPFLELLFTVNLILDSTNLLNGEIQKFSLQLQKTHLKDKFTPSYLIHGGLKLLIPFLKRFLEKKIENSFQAKVKELKANKNTFLTQINQLLPERFKQTGLEVKTFEICIFPTRDRHLPLNVKLHLNCETDPTYKVSISSEIKNDLKTDKDETSVLLLHVNHLLEMSPEIQASVMRKSQKINLTDLRIGEENLVMQFTVEGWTKFQVKSEWIISDQYLSFPPLITTTIESIEKNPVGWMLRLLKGMVEKRITSEIKERLTAIFQTESKPHQFALSIDKIPDVLISMNFSNGIGLSGNFLKLDMNLSVSLSHQPRVPLLPFPLNG